MAERENSETELTSTSHAHKKCKAALQVIQPSAALLRNQACALGVSARRSSENALERGRNNSSFPSFFPYFHRRLHDSSEFFPPFLSVDGRGRMKGWWRIYLRQGEKRVVGLCGGSENGGKAKRRARKQRTGRWTQQLNTHAQLSGMATSE
mmetsp:Transcript_14323/g.28781  ORF Transcript_14323/g.28781 Transcript_14323/m.28781 type:complete len:151 (+) Transcript_14323:596-1048(+)